ncbi:Outer membrane efflux protein (plasmid) [Caballeronia sp. SBC1]|uniref:TolC family protein n=1 Tax=unclassified Caballeronia TaxID=2646786 RepID=UPI0013E1528E|nr:MULTISPECIES: TolC family protein [unclassified Caballeronia]QIE25896.1 Outer membrane efflux protein [Caballeronia sp. SBC2]QIN64791.1 Outer membrane efflux protein [Caballeronia sp. SBC1]
MRALEPTPWLIALTAAGLAGCATSSLDLAPPAPDRPWQPQTNAFGDIVPGPPRTGADAARAGYSLPNSTGLAFVEPAAQLDANHAYTLPELVDLAESTNPLTRIAWNDARNAALAAGIAKAAYLPQLSATAMGGYQASSGSASTPLGNNSTSSDIHGTVSLLALQWLLFDFGGRRARVDAATQLSVAANVAFTAVHQRVIHDVSIAYYGYEAASARAHTAQQALDNAGGILTAARARLKQGVGTVVEVAQATQNQAQANLAKVQSDGAESDSYLNLVSALGISPLSKPTIAPLPPRALSPALHQSVDEIVADAIARRPDVQGAYALEQANQARIRAAEAAFMPKVFVSATAAYGTGSTAITAVPPVGDQAATVNLSGSHRSGNVFVGVTIPLYDGGLRSAVLMQARNDADSASAQFTRTREEAVRQIVVAQNALSTSLASNDAAKALVAAAQTTYNAAFAAYRHGVGPITDALLSQNQLIAAQNAYADSYSAALSAAASLALATGEIGAIAPDGDPAW